MKGQLVQVMDVERMQVGRFHVGDFGEVLEWSDLGCYAKVRFVTGVAAGKEWIVDLVDLEVIPRNAIAEVPEVSQRKHGPLLESMGTW